MQNRAMPIKAVLFHFESTLVMPASLDMTVLKVSIGCPADLHIVDHVRNLIAAEGRKAAIRKLENLELQAAHNARLDPAASNILQYLMAKDVRLAVVTAGGRPFVDVLLQKTPDIGPSDFAVIVNRKHLLELNSTDNAVRLAIQKLNILPGELLVVASE